MSFSDQDILSIRPSGQQKVPFHECNRLTVQNFTQSSLQRQEKILPNRQQEELLLPKKFLSEYWRSHR